MFDERKGKFVVFIREYPEWRIQLGSSNLKTKDCFHLIREAYYAAGGGKDISLR